MRKLVFPLLALALLLGAALLAPGRPATATSAVRIQDDANILSAADRQNITAAAQRAPMIEAPDEELALMAEVEGRPVRWISNDKFMSKLDLGDGR